MDRYVIVDIRSDEVEEARGKRALSRKVKASVPTITKWFVGRNVYMCGSKIIGRIKEVENQ